MPSSTDPTRLSAAQSEDFARELNAIRDEVLASRGTRDRLYLLRLLSIQRRMLLAGRGLIAAAAFFLPIGGHALAHPWVFATLVSAGVLGLGFARILENMEIAHNVMHAQWDWMNDPDIRSDTWEWDSACPSEQWRHSHNVIHHTWTNVLGMDRDIGYGMLRVTQRQRWCPFYLLQPVNVLLMALLFDWFIAAHDLEINRLVAGAKRLADVRSKLAAIGRKVLRQAAKDYVLWPLLAAVLTMPCAAVAAAPSPGLAFAVVLVANMAANLIRNAWVFAIVFCGHFPRGVHHFTKQTIEDGETRGRWYERQLLGSCNITGGPLFHVMSGNLSHQIEHHLFPDICSNRYSEIAPRVRAIAHRYGLPYHTGSLAKQFITTAGMLLSLSFPSPSFGSEKTGQTPAAKAERLT
jgi:NADPH-dependent stearoyl-CoA 9-desaturase